MKINFKKITALATSALMVGMTMGVAAAANYPAPFVSGSTADVAIVYGTGSGVSQLDLVHAANIQDSLSGYLSGTTSTTTTTSGEVVSLDTSATRIWLNTSLNTAKSTLTKTDLPTVLKDYTFEGDVSSKITSTLKFQSGNTATTAGTANTGTVIFSKQPKSSNDPVFGISLGSSQTSYPLYNASATMSAVNFTNSESEGEDITLFGQTFTVSSDTDSTDLVLLKEAEKLSLTSDAPTATVNIGGADWTVELVSASDTAATVKVTDSAGTSESKEINEADSKKVNGLTVAVQTADETNLKLSATLIAGAQKLTLQAGSSVTLGDNADPIDGTFVYLTGGTTATTEIAVAVYRPDSSDDAILEGTDFVDPVFGSFKINFAGLSTPAGDAGRENISVDNSGDDSMTVTFTNGEGYTKTLPFAHNGTYALGQSTYPVKLGGLADWRLADDSNYTIFPHEGANLTEDDYTIVGNEDYGHMVQVIQIYNNTGTDYTKDEVKLQDAMSGETYSSTFTSEGHGTVSIDGKQYTVTFLGSGDTGYTTIKWPTSDSSTSSTWVLFPTIETKNGNLVAFYEPMNISLDAFNGTAAASNVFKFPDGDGYTSGTFTYLHSVNNSEANWTLGSNYLFTGNTTAVGANTTSNLTIGELTYSFYTDKYPNRTVLYLLDPEGSAVLNEPSLIVFEGKNDNSRYEAFVINLETAPGGSSTNGAGIDDILFTPQEYHDSASLASDSDITQDVDWYGAISTIDADDSDQKTISVTLPKAQVYAQIYVGEDTSAVTPGTTGGSGASLGNVLVADSAVSSVNTKNLVVVGGSCINSAAATLVGGAYCGAAWTTATGVGAGQFLIKGYATSTLTSKLALLVAGYEAADTVNAATYLRTKTVDTAKEYKGTSSTEATLVTTTA